MQISKFRAWDTTNKTMIYFDDYNNPEIIDVLGFPALVFRSNNRSRNIDNIGEVELMQSTGLLDKNGVEIFEGDFFKNHKETFLVVFIKERACFFAINKNETDYINALNFSKQEIIGNKFTNPELLK